MTRECSEDFERIKSYINGYDISKNLSNKKYASSLKRMHKCYFSAVTWNAELLHNKEHFVAISSDYNNDIVFRLAEAVSDLGSSLFNWSNGNYKASRVLLRVAIENFIRGVSSIEDKTQLSEKNVYQLFSNASDQNTLKQHEKITSCYESLHSDYKLLCEDAHTATVQNMAHITSLADLPTFDRTKSEDNASVYVRVSKNMTSMFCLLFNSFYQNMHHRNRENILNSLSKSIKPHIIAPES